MSCEKHKKRIKKYDGNLKELAKDIGDLHYEALAEFLNHLSVKFVMDAQKDYQDGRKKLAEELFNATHGICKVKENIQKAWNISKPFMK